MSDGTRRRDANRSAWRVAAYRLTMAVDAVTVAVRFNGFINARNSDGLSELMTDDHVFTDSAGHSITGKPACLAAWCGFFDSFPEYRNTFESMQASAGIVTIAGHSVCPGHPELEGPALWSAVIVTGQVSYWRVHEDTPRTRKRLGIA